MRGTCSSDMHVSGTCCYFNYFPVITVAIKQTSRQRARLLLCRPTLAFDGSATTAGIPRSNLMPRSHEISDGSARGAPRSAMFPSARSRAGIQPLADGVVDARETDVAAECRPR